MPPDHGAAIVNEILTTDALRASWTDEVGSMRSRIAGLRRDVVAKLKKAAPDRDFSFIERQHGMFSFLGASKDQVRELREKHHIYMTDDSRINIAGLRGDNIEYFADSVAQVLTGGK
jgi:aspartate aminotransferase